MMRWLLPFGVLLALAGYFGPWVDHRVAGLVITGLDLGEYVKFLPIVREGTVNIWREGFYAPLVAASVAALLAAYRVDFAYRWWMRIPLLLVAVVAALNLVPPAWTPARLLEPEFRLQTTSLILLLVGVGLSPFLALLPRLAAATVVTVLAIVGMFAPLHGFLQVFPAIESLYHQPLTFAWGPPTMIVGLALTIISYWWPRPKEQAISAS